MKGCMQLNPVYNLEDFRCQWESSPGLLDWQADAYLTEQVTSDLVKSR